MSLVSSWNSSYAVYTNTDRVLSKLSSMLSHLVVDNPLGHTISRSCFGQELGMAQIVQHGIENGGLVNGSTHSQKAGKAFMSEHNTSRVEQLTRDSGGCMQCCPCPGHLQSAFLLPERARFRHGDRRSRYDHTNCMRLHPSPVSLLPQKDIFVNPTNLESAYQWVSQMHSMSCHRHYACEPRQPHRDGPCESRNGS